MSEERDPYAVLGVPRNASVRQIRTAYLVRARRSHPDLVGVRGLELMRDINEAWETLKDSARRAAYDAATGGTGATGSAGATPRVDDDPNRPFWTGAAGPPPGRPWGHVLDFGIFAGWSLGEISRRDRGYLQWLLNRPEAKAFREEIVRLLDPDAQDPAQERRRGRR
ncbi:MAG TPA: DnaJ domain-containing protein [Candidatus Limnocylindria bacterium]|nr:DnaJ domain-containing protein [Candidatus Limnocylindria bacterium]